MADYIDSLQQEIADYTGPYLDQLQWLPKLHNFFLALYEDPRLHRQGRMMCNAAIAYILLPFDIIPETSMGTFGYIDDLYLAAEVLQHLQQDNSLGNLLDDIWPEERLIGSVVAELLTKCGEALDEDDRRSILQLSGLGD